MSSPLLQLHRQIDAELQPYADVEIVSTFGEPQAEYAAIHKGCGLMDLPQRGIIELNGDDRLSFLNNLLSNQTYDKSTKRGLSPGQGVYAFLLNAKSGRIIADMNVLELGGKTLLELDRRHIDSVIPTLERYRFAEKVRITDQKDALHEIALHGSGGLALLSGLGMPTSDMTPLASVSSEVVGVPATIWRDDPAGVPGFHLLVPIEAAAQVWVELLKRFGASTDLGRRTLRPIGWAAFNTARIEAGRPMFGIDFDETILPHETGPLLNRAVSFTKGCYPGQEIVARMHARQQVAKRIVGIRMNDDALPVAGAKIYDASDNEIGGLTSSTPSPISSNAIFCLGIVKRPSFEIGTVIRTPAEGKMREGSVVELPFLKAATVLT